VITRIKISKKYLAATVLLVMYLCCVSSCTKPDTQPQLELTVVNISGQPVSQVLVGLFDELDQWSMLENPVQAWRETDQSGKVLFVDLHEQVYYFYADGDSLSNIGHEIRLDEALKINEIRRVTITIE